MKYFMGYYEEVEAIQWDGTVEGRHQVTDWFNENDIPWWGGKDIEFSTDMGYRNGSGEPAIKAGQWVVIYQDRRIIIQNEAPGIFERWIWGMDFADGDRIAVASSEADARGWLDQGGSLVRRAVIRFPDYLQEGPWFNIS